MQNSLEIQILSPATREQLIELRDELRKIEGMEGFELEIPLPAQRPGTMSGALAVEITMGLIAGVTHYTSEKTFEFLVTRVAEVIKKTFKHKAGTEKIMGAADKKDWEVIVSGGNNGTKSNIYLDSDGNKKDFSNRQYSIDPDKTYALLIGVATYDDEAHFAAIPPVERNLDDMYGVLNDKRIMGLPMKNINLVFNQTNAVIRKELGKLAQLSDIETLIIYFAGHGQNDGNNKLTLIAKDTYTDDEELCYDIPYAFIEQKINRSPAAQKIILIDACNSGLATQSGIPKPDFEPVKGSFILASTSADKASYYNTEEKNTRFTHYLLDVFNNGIANAKAMLSLDDLYHYTRDKLTAKKLPSPTCKSELENIITDKFYISKNPAFLLGDKLTEIDQLYRNGAYEEARKEYRLLIKEYPDEPQVTKAYSNFDMSMQYIMLVNEANSLFYNEKDYAAAKEKYAEAYEIKEEEIIKNKIRECNLLLNKSRIETITPLRQAIDISPVTVKDDIKLSPKEPKTDPVIKPVTKLSRNKMKLIVAGFLATVFTAVILSVFTHKESTVKSPSPANQDTAVSPPVPDPSPVNTASTLSRTDTVVDTKAGQKTINAGALQDSIFRVRDTAIKGGEKNATMSPDEVAKNGKFYFNNRQWEKAFPMLYAVQNMDDPRVWVDLGDCYYFGFGTKMNYKETARLYLKAAERGDAMGEMKIGFLYSRGDGVEKNNSKRVYWLEKSAAQGQPLAQEGLAKLYESGEAGLSTREAKDSAVALYRRAAKQGIPNAKAALKRLGYAE